MESTNVENKNDDYKAKYYNNRVKANIYKYISKNRAKIN